MEQQTPLPLIPPEQSAAPAATSWSARLATYRVAIIVVAVLLAGATGTLLLLQSRQSASLSENQQRRQTQSDQADGDTTKSLKLQASDDPVILEAEMQDINASVDSSLDTEIDGLVNDITQLE